MKNINLLKKNFVTPIRFIVLAYLGVILTGTLLLMLPISNTSGEMENFVNSLFNATSGVCVTGLSVFNIHDNYTLFGQIVLLLLIQIGGLGFMTIATMMFLLLGKKISLKDRLVISETMNESSLGGLIPVVKKVFVMTFIIEGVGAILLAFVFIPDFGFIKGSYYAIFHAVSAFCNAGFDILPGDASFTAYRGNILLNIVIMTLIVLGGFGYVVIFDVLKRKKRVKLTIHTKIVLFVSLFLIISSSLVYLIAEYNNPNTTLDLSFKEKILSSVFLAVNSRTAGFFTYDYSYLTTGSKLMVILNMFIGGSPASTAGGIKTTTAFVIVVYFFSTLKNKKEITIKKSTIPQKSINRAISILILASIITFIFTFTLSIVESGFNLESILFEVTSALATVGLSVGVSANASVFGKIMLSILMFCGRIGVLTISMFFINNKIVNPNLKYSDAKIMIG